LLKHSDVTPAFLTNHLHAEPFCNPFLCSVVCHLLHLSILLKLFHRFTCHLAGTLVESSGAVGTLC